MFSHYNHQPLTPPIRQPIISNMNDISITSQTSITSKDEAQEYLEIEARKMLPDAVTKLRTALHAASKPEEIIKVVDAIRSYSQVKKTSDQSNIATGIAIGSAISGDVFANAFKAMTNIFGVDLDSKLPEREVRELEKEEIVEKMEILDEETEEQEGTVLLQEESEDGEEKPGGWDGPERNEIQF